MDQEYLTVVLYSDTLVDRESLAAGIHGTIRAMPQGIHARSMTVAATPRDGSPVEDSWQPDKGPFPDRVLHNYSWGFVRSPKASAKSTQHSHVLDISFSDASTSPGFRSCVGTVIAIQLSVAPFVHDREAAWKAIWENGRVHNKDDRWRESKSNQSREAGLLIRSWVETWTSLHPMQSGHVGIEPCSATRGSAAYTLPGIGPAYSLPQRLEVERWMAARAARRDIIRGMYWGMFFGASLRSRIESHGIDLVPAGETARRTGAWSLRTACGGLFRACSHSCLELSQYSEVPGVLHEPHVLADVVSQLLSLETSLRRAECIA